MPNDSPNPSGPSRGASRFVGAGPARRVFTVHIFAEMMKSLRSPRSEDVGGIHPELARKADICAKVLVEARRLSQMGQFGALLNQFVVRADELLDDMDEILVTLSPVRSAPNFVIAAQLHRELEHVQAAITDQRRRAAKPASAGSTP